MGSDLCDQPSKVVSKMRRFLEGHVIREPGVGARILFRLLDAESQPLIFEITSMDQVRMRAGTMKPLSPKDPTKPPKIKATGAYAFLSVQVLGNPSDEVVYIGFEVKEDGLTPIWVTMRVRRDRLTGVSSVEAMLSNHFR